MGISRHSAFDDRQAAPFSEQVIRLADGGGAPDPSAHGLKGGEGFGQGTGHLADDLPGRPGNAAVGVEDADREPGDALSVHEFMDILGIVDTVVFAHGLDYYTNVVICQEVAGY